MTGQLSKARGDSTGRTLTLGRAVATVWPCPEYVLGPLQPGDVGLLSGADGLGKSWVAFAAALAVAKGRTSVCGGLWDVPHGVAGPVLYIAVEDREADHGRRLQRLVGHCVQAGEIGPSGLEDDSLVLWSLEGRRLPLVAPTQGKAAMARFDVTPMGAEFAGAIQDHRLVIVDPLRAFHDLDESDGAGMDFLVRWLVSVAIRNQQVILLVHHASQGAILERREDHHAGRGATDLPAGCRGVWTLRSAMPSEVEDEAERRQWRVLVNGKATHSGEAAKRFIRKGDGGVMLRDTPPIPVARGGGHKRNAYRAARNGDLGAGGEDDDY